MAGKVGVGVWAGVGSLVGLFVGSIVGGMLTNGGKSVQGGKGAAKIVVPALAGTALGAFAGAAMSAATPNTVTTTTTTTGAGKLPKPEVTRALAGLGAGVGADKLPKPGNVLASDASLSRYDGRYQLAGVEPPHKCTAASAQAIARQLDPRWTYAGSVSSVRGMKETMAHVTTSMGSKTIPTWTDGKSLVIQCPYTGEHFRFTRSGTQA
jgi:hypothetical protein